jgi:hypothetical protein
MKNLNKKVTKSGMFFKEGRHVQQILFRFRRFRQKIPMFRRRVDVDVAEKSKE